MMLSLGFLALAVLFLRHYGLGGSLNTLGIIFTIGSILIFVFFLSIDPGYGWARSINYSVSYTVIATSVVICIVGIMLMALGRGMHEGEERKLAASNRCDALRAGEATKVMAEEWFYLASEKNMTDISLYLFRKRGDIAAFKIVVLFEPGELGASVKELVISSPLLEQPIKVMAEECLCPGVYEKDLSVGYANKEQLSIGAQFTVTMIGSSELVGPEGKFPQFVLYASAPDSLLSEESEKGNLETTAVH